MGGGGGEGGGGGGGRGVIIFSWDCYNYGYSLTIDTTYVNTIEAHTYTPNTRLVLLLIVEFPLLI